MRKKAELQGHHSGDSEVGVVIDYITHCHVTCFSVQRK